MTTISFRPLGLVKELLEQIGQDVSHVWEDLVFVNHNAFLLQMGEQGKNLFLFFNMEALPDQRQGILLELKRKGKELGFDISEKGSYTLAQKDDQTIDIQFFPNQN